MKKVGDYILVSELGKGQFGIVYKAKHSATGDIYAVKTVKKESVNSNPKLKSLFETEINIMSKIKHPNILHLYEYLETGNNFYLVIDYCNNGDMESHLKKHTLLGEDEAVYFLMQIMNGFRELHKHKIMHRDFKLANIFLNDDKLIIGDFGFAKSGVDMTTTKLGSPITMAPEMLLSTGGKVTYTNKADLWSIGVCFFQMIFGCLPWDVKDLDELKIKVQNESGKNLHIPTDKCTITQECADLLRALLETNPKLRIEWDDFFNHKLFEIHQKKKKQKANLEEIKQSVMFRNNEDQVEEMFKKNKNENKAEVELMQEPEEVELPATPAQPSTPVENITRLKNRVLARYTHEKKTIVFFMYTCRKLRNLAKDRATFKKAANGLMFVSILLLRKGIIMNQIAIYSLKKGINTYHIEGFNEFLTLEDKNRLIEDLELKDHVLYTKLFSHLKEKAFEEIGKDDKRTNEIVSMVDNPSCSMELIEKELKQETYYLIQYFSKSINSFSNKVKYEMMMALAHLYTSSNHKEFLDYMVDGIPFDWNEFDKSWDGDPGVEKINQLLNKAISSK